METKTIYLIMREWINPDGSTHTEEAARFDRMEFAGLFMQSLAAQPNYEAVIDYMHLDCIWAVSVRWTGGGEAHRYMMAEAVMDENGNIDEWA